MLLKSPVAGATVVALGLLVASCSSGSGTKAVAPSAAGVTSATGTAASSEATTATTGGNAAPVVVCTTLPTAQVASLSGIALTSSREQDFAADNNYTCAYYPASGVGGMSVTVKVVGGAISYANTLNTDQAAGPAENVTPVAGIGDKAFSAHDGVHVLFADRMISVAGLTSVQPAEAIVEALQARLK